MQLELVLLVTELAVTNKIHKITRCLMIR